MMIEKLYLEFSETYFSEISSTKGIEELASNIGVSKNTLRRFLKKIKSESNLSNITLNLISESLGYKDFKEFSTKSNHNQNIDFPTLEIFYNSIKNKGVNVTEKRFQDINYLFSKKIILNHRNLNTFFDTFKKNPEALEYVLAWHPTYGMICQNEYQTILKKYADITDRYHIKIFVSSFILFGDFLANKLTKNNLRIIEKAEIDIHSMRSQDNFFWAFPEVRFAIAKTLFIHNTNPTKLKSYITLIIEKLKCMPNSFNKSIFALYYSDALNLIEEYDTALLMQTKFIDSSHFTKKTYYHSNTQNLFYKITKAITLYHTGYNTESLNIYNELKKLDLKNLPFDIKSYFEIQYYILAFYFNKKDLVILGKIKSLISKTEFYRFNKYI